jgi:twitching motility protein PilJ
MRMLSQRLAKASSLALQGNQQAFTQLTESRDTFALLLGRLSEGGEINGISAKLRDKKVDIDKINKGSSKRNNKTSKGSSALS